MNLVSSMDDPRVTASLLRWWVESGVDALVDEAPQPWLKRSGVASAPQVAEAKPAYPETLAQFTDWLMSADSFAWAGHLHQRIAPFGTPHSALMVLTDLPSNEDIQAGSLFSGAEGQLIDAMLKAVGLTRNDIYCAPLLPARPLTGQLDADHLDQLGEIARHHIRLAAPKRVWLLGQSTSRALLGSDVSGQPAKLHNINHDGGTVSATASFHPRVLLQHPKRKAKVWADMQMLFGGMNT